jgi:hypothetical protein
MVGVGGGSGMGLYANPKWLEPIFRKQIKRFAKE